MTTKSTQIILHNPNLPPFQILYNPTTKITIPTNNEEEVKKMIWVSNPIHTQKMIEAGLNPHIYQFPTIHPQTHYQKIPVETKKDWTLNQSLSQQIHGKFSVSSSVELNILTHHGWKIIEEREGEWVVEN